MSPASAHARAPRAPCGPSRSSCPWARTLSPRGGKKAGDKVAWAGCPRRLTGRAAPVRPFRRRAERAMPDGERRSSARDDALNFPVVRNSPIGSGIAEVALNYQEGGLSLDAPLLLLLACASAAGWLRACSTLLLASASALAPAGSQPICCCILCFARPVLSSLYCTCVLHAQENMNFLCF